ncbi:hypothetical protein LTR94_034294, partial [Friedmanniomyces endolithicus]
MIPEDRREDAHRRVGRIDRQRARLNSFVSIPLKLLSKGKRRSGRIDVNSCVANLLELLGPIMEHFNVSARFEPTSTRVAINGSEALLEGILLNLITNSINAFQRRKNDDSERLIRIATAYDGDVLLIVEDNAGGIRDLE